MKPRLLRWLLWLISLPLLSTGVALAAELQEGKQFIRLSKPHAVESGQKIEVIEFFSYGCPHCNDLEPYLTAWAKKLPADVDFKRVPVMFQERWIGLAKVYYTLDALGEAARLTPEVFSAIHGKGLPLFQDKVFFDWAAQHGLDRAKVADVYGSFGVNSKVNRAKVLAQEYNIQAVPTIIVDGKFLTSSDRVGGHPEIPTAIDGLIVKARAERSKH